MVQLLGSTSPKARNLAAQTLAKLIAAYPDARSGHHSVLCCNTLRCVVRHMRGAYAVLHRMRQLLAVVDFRDQPTSYKLHSTSQTLPGLNR